MTKNIKEIGKELMGKSLNSFHKKTGLTQLEKNNEMQDGVLDGILSQVDDAYIEKIEQSNVMHLDGSGDGVVVIDSIEGNTIINLWNFDNVTDRYNVTYSNKVLTLTSNDAWGSCRLKLPSIKQNTVYTLIVNILENTTDSDIVYINDCDASKSYFTIAYLGVNKLGINKVKVTSKNEDLSKCNMGIRTNSHSGYIKLQYVILEGDWTDKEIPPYFEGLQSSFEEKVNDEGKYEIEILSKNNNLIEESVMFKYANYTKAVENVTHYSEVYSQSESNITKTRILGEPIPLIQNKTMYFKCDGFQLARAYFNKDLIFLRDDAWKSNTTKLEPPKDAKYIALYLRKPDDSIITDSDIKFVKENAILGCFEKYEDIKKIAPKQNKIKLLINEPLRGTDDVKDRLCVKDGKLMIERSFYQILLNGTETVSHHKNMTNTTSYRVENILLNISDKVVACDNFKVEEFNTLYNNDVSCITTHDENIHIYIRTPIKNGTNAFKQWLNSNNTKVVIQRSEPIYEEVLNEYGEPIILEGYENGTIYIDSIIVPTTTVSYTPKMESFKTIKEVKDNNIMLTSDINDAIIPYMMEVDMMIMEKEIAIMSRKNIRKIGEKDMTSMQKRTYDMLARLIKGKTLTVDECKNRVTVYLNADKITDTQAEELMLLIDEVYA